MWNSGILFGVSHYRLPHKMNRSGIVNGQQWIFFVEVQHSRRDTKATFFLSIWGVTVWGEPYHHAKEQTKLISWKGSLHAGLVLSIFVLYFAFKIIVQCSSFCHLRADWAEVCWTFVGQDHQSVQQMIPHRAGKRRVLRNFWGQNMTN